jgi:hypothetical protein
MRGRMEMRRTVRICGGLRAVFCHVVSGVNKRFRALSIILRLLSGKDVRFETLYGR